jgi:hypothetical protein
LIMDAGGEFSECENCGTQYKQEAMKQMRLIRYLRSLLI